MRSKSKSSLLEEALGARSKIAVLRCLFRSKLGYSGSAIAEQAGMGLYAVQNTLGSLEKLGLIEVERGRVEHRYRLNTHHYLATGGLRALFENERQMKEKLANELRSLLEGHVTTAGIFGSFARGEAKAGSDIDVFIAVGTLKERDWVTRTLSDAQQEMTRRYGLPLQPVIFERRRLVSRRGNARDLLENAARDWHHIAGLKPQELLKSLRPRKSSQTS